MYKTIKCGSNRLSARCYFDTHGSESEGDRCDDKCLKLDKNKIPKWLKGNCNKPCKEISRHGNVPGPGLNKSTY